MRDGAPMRMCAAEKVSRVEQRLNGVDIGVEERQRVSNVLGAVCFSRLRSRVGREWKSRFVFYYISNFLFLRGKKLLNCVLLSISAHKFMHENVIKLSIISEVPTFFTCRAKIET